MLRSLSVAAVLLASCAGRSDPAAATAPPTASADGVEWTEFGPEALARADASDRMILINVVAEWCHWCHVMEETTYSDPEVAALLREHFVTIRVDSDARPDVAERYRAWGWPATAVLTPDARPVTELRGYRNPEAFARLLRVLVADKTAGTLGHRVTPSGPPHASAEDLGRVRARLTGQMDPFWDDERAGWGQRQKYPWPAPIAVSLLRSRIRPDEAPWRDRALRTLTAERHLVDPVWGGMYQYSVGGTWDDPHFEKIAMIQAGAIETYALAYRATSDPAWLESARAVARYELSMMQDPDGGFYTSQDADLRRDDGTSLEGARFYALDDAGRRAEGMPRIDTAVYADLNGLVIESLCELARAADDETVRRAAVRAGERLLRSHWRSDRGAFLHAEGDDPRGLLHLADQAAMGGALIALYEVTADERWRDTARALGAFMLRELQADDGGFYAHTADPTAVGVFAQRRRPVEENGQAARFLAALHHLDDGDGTAPTPYLDAARRAVLRVGMTPELPRAGKVVGRLLLATELLGSPHFDVTIVGVEGDPTADALWRAALRWYEPRATVERSAPGERYPDIGRAAAYLCTDTACSTPIGDPGRFATIADAFVRANAGD